MAKTKARRDITVKMQGFVDEKECSIFPLLYISLVVATKFHAREERETELSKLWVANAHLQQAEYEKDPGTYRERVMGQLDQIRTVFG